MGGGGKGGGGGHTPIEKPNTLESAQRLKIIDLLCEGVAGTDVTFKNIYLDNTPIQNADGTYNFTGIRVSALPGTHNQDYLAGFDSTDKIVSVGAEVKAATPITRTITDPLVDSVRVTLALGSLVKMTDKGDRVGGSVSLTVMCGNKSYPVTISGKTTSAYHQDVILTELPDVPFNISVQRNTPDSTTDKVSNATHWVSYVESIDAKFNYPNSVVVGLEIDSAQFGGQIPKRTYRNKWTQIKVPNNYDPITRTYEGVWLGEFKTAWSDNPAWVFYDLVTDKRYGLGDRLGEFGCDKWSLYQIAKYCDQIVPDGFGGEEPRFTCNAYLSEPRDAKALLDDLASVFRGIAVWDGQMVTALQDAKKDPVATYSNSNVVDGMFAYSGAAQKTIFTAVHVKYNDKTDSYTTKTEYVANDDAIKRYGLNVKQITAFGCTSRGQAARVGKWLIETSIRERQMVSFSVGREGIRHLPFDIIEIADNDYAGDMIGGRVLSVTGNTITVDRTMSDVSSIRYYADGQSKTVSVIAIQDNKITLSDTPVGIKQLGVFSATKTGVKPRLFRALSIKEDDGTYTISAVQHDENKEAIVDQGATFEQDDTATKHKPQVSYGRVSKDGDELVLSWEGTNTTQYLIKIYKDGELYNSYTQDTAEIKLKGLSNGEYRAEIRGRSANGELTEAVIKEWSIDYDISGLKATPELFAIKLDWTNPTTVINKAKIEIYRSQTADRATATKVATLSYPTDTFTQNGVKLSETHHFWLRLIDDQGNTGNWVTVSGQCSSDTSQIVASINGQITETELAQSLIDSLQDDIDTAKSQAIGSASTDAANKVAAEATARSNAIQAEATTRSNAIQAEANARTQAIAAQDTKQTNALLAKAQELGTQISDVSDVNNQQAQQLTTITAKQGDLTSGLETERTARIAGDAAEATARQTLVSQVNGNKTSITSLQSTKASKTEVSSIARTALQSEWKNYADDKVNNLEIGGRNLIIQDNLTIDYYFTETGELIPTTNYTTTDFIAVSQNSEYVLSGANNGLTHSAVSYWDEFRNLLSYEYLNGYTAIKSQIITTPPNTKFVRIRASKSSRYEGDSYEYWKLERGTKATDWTPAPEDVTASIDVVSSDLTEFKETTANKDQAQTVINNQALSRINNAESSITSLQSTKASKDEVSSLARTALQSEWQSAATTAKAEAISAAATDAQAKADAALASAKTDAQTKADAAKAAAQTYATQQVNAKSVTDKAYADGLVTAEEQRAINDANAKLAAAKADAKTKADAAELAAINVAKADATVKANTAKAEAISAAATDAQTKADAAKTAAQTYATQQVNAKSVTDKAYADGLVTAEEQRAINDANAKLAAAKADAKTKADAAEAAAKAHAELKVDNLEIGGKNLLSLESKTLRNYQDSVWLRGDEKVVLNDISKGWVQLYPKNASVGEHVLSFKIRRISGDIKHLGGHTNPHSSTKGLIDNDIWFEGDVWDAPVTLRPISDTLEHSVSVILNVVDTVNPIYIQINRGMYNFDYECEIWDIQLEKGNKATDWTPAPEDVAADIDTVSSELTSFKQTTASKDSAQTVVNTQALSRINDSESSITSLQSTKASKTEVSSLARTALQSEWQDAATTAKTQAITAAATDAKAKADAALASAKTDAQTKADAAKAAAQTYATQQVAAKSVTDKAYADGLVTAEEQRAINDANAKLAAAKADAKTKADAAELAAINVAKADATVKANTAKAEAISAAATDAQTKADAAKTAAQTYATQQVNAKSVTDKAYADGLVTAEEQRAINDANAKLAAAKADAKTKADAAELAAINVAKADATVKANTAKAEAISAAATDAQTKADAAKTAAQTYATQQVNAKSVTDKAYADGLVTAEEQRAINDANAKLAAAKADAKTKADAAEAAAKAHAELKVDNLEIGGKNLLSLESKTLRNYQDSVWLRGDEKVVLNDISKGWVQLYPKNASVGEHVLSFKIRRISGDIKHLGGHTNPHSSTKGLIDNDIWFEGDVWDEPVTLRPISDTLEHSVSVILNVVDTVNPIYIQINRGMYNFDYECEIWDIQLEKGTKATDWTPAPEDVAADIDTVSSELTSFKQTTASKDSAQTVVNTQALSRINDSESSITSLQSTKASKTEVSSLARTALQSEWQDAATTAKTQAITAAATDAKAKADAALASAKTDAQTKADAAKAAAQTYATQQVAAKSVTDKAYADGLVTAEEQRAINDANAKLAAAKADAKTKADAAELAAINVAKADATVKANTAKAEAISAAATDAQTKADAAKTAAQTYATQQVNAKSVTDKAYADGLVTAEEQRAINDANAKLAAAKADAKTKADAAELAAINVAKADATVKANTAKAEAISAAATDAQTKADAAKTAAQTYATQQVNAKSVTDKAYADGLVTAEEQRAINDANAKLAAAKADAKTKADAAEAAAKAHAELKVDNLEIGGKNLLSLESKTLRNYQDSVWLRGDEKVVLNDISKGWVQLYPKNASVGEHVLSFKIRRISGDIKHLGGHTNPHSSTKGLIDNDIWFEGDVWDEPVTLRPISDTLEHSVSVILNVVDTVNPIYIQINRGMYNFDYECEIWDIQLEKGTKATDWTPAPEDVAASIDIVSSDLTEFKETTASKDSAQTIVNNQALSRINDSESKITTLQNTSVTKDKAQSTHTIKTQAIAGGQRAIAGIAIGAMANETTAESQVIVMADKFGVVKDAGDSNVKPMLTVVNNQVAVNGDLIANGTILGKHIKANQTLSAPIINGGSLNINNQFEVDKFGNMTAKSGRFEGTVLANQISGTIDIATMKRSAWTAGYRLFIIKDLGASRSVPSNYDSVRQYSSLVPSYGGLSWSTGSDSAASEIGGAMFEIEVDVAQDITVSQKSFVIDNVLNLYVNDIWVGNYGTRYPDTNDGIINFDLRSGINKIQYILVNTGSECSLSLLGDFIDNNNVKFA